MKRFISLILSVAMLAAFIAVPSAMATGPVNVHVQAIGAAVLTAGNTIQVGVNLNNANSRSIGSISYVDIHFDNSVLEWNIANINNYNPDTSSTWPFSRGAVSTDNSLSLMAPQHIYNRGGATAVTGQHAGRFSFESQDDFTGQGQLLILNLRVRSTIAGTTNVTARMVDSAANMREFNHTLIPMSDISFTHTPVGAPTFQLNVNSTNSGPTIPGAGLHPQNHPVTLTAPVVDTHTFTGWSVTPSVSLTGGSLNNPASRTISFNMLAQTVTATAGWTPVPTHNITMQGLVSGGGFSHGTPAVTTNPVVQGRTVSINAGTPPSGQIFDRWSSTPAVSFANMNSPTTTFTMPTQAITVTAVWKEDDRPFIPVTVNVNGGSGGSGGTNNYLQGDPVSISAGTLFGWNFDGWTLAGVGSLSFTSGNLSSANATFTMPGVPVSLSARWVRPGGPIPNLSITQDVPANMSLPSGQQVAGWWLSDQGPSSDALNAPPVLNGVPVSAFTTAATLEITFDRAITSALMPNPGWGERPLDVIWRGTGHDYVPAVQWNGPDGAYSGGAVRMIGGTHSFTTLSINLSTQLAQSSTFRSLPEDGFVGLAIVSGWWDFDITQYIQSARLTYTGTQPGENSPLAGAPNVTMNGHNGVSVGTFNTGTTVTLNAGVRPGFTFAGWQINSGNLAALPVNTITTFTMPVGNVSVTPLWNPNQQQIVFGDIDGDGVIDAADITLLRRYVAANDKNLFMSQNPRFRLENARLVGQTSGEPGAADVARLRQYVAGFPVTLGTP
jgi:uncharacterized repeat protein (TIGR02543 family)